jgi:hypothetical protein
MIIFVRVLLFISAVIVPTHTWICNAAWPLNPQDDECPRAGPQSRGSHPLKGNEQDVVREEYRKFPCDDMCEMTYCSCCDRFYHEI